MDYTSLVHKVLNHHTSYGSTANIISSAASSPILVFTQPMKALIGKQREPFHAGDYKFKSIDVRRLYNELCEQWSSRQCAGASRTDCIDKEKEILKNWGIHMPIDFEEGEQHPLKNCPAPELYSSVLKKWLQTRAVHIDNDQMYGRFTNGEYVLKDETDSEGAICIWPKEIYAAVYAARRAVKKSPKSRDEWYEEYMNWPIDRLLGEKL